VEAFLGPSQVQRGRSEFGNEQGTIAVVVVVAADCVVVVVVVVGGRNVRLWRWRWRECLLLWLTLGRTTPHGWVAL